jgi:hypothetical protein
MGIAAAYDLVFGLAILGFHRAAGALLQIPPPADPVFLRLNGLLLLLLAGMYTLPAVAPRRYQGVVVVAAAGRLLGAFYLGYVAWQGAPRAFAFLACGDLIFAVMHAVLLFAARLAGRASATDRST